MPFLLALVLGCHAPDDSAVPDGIDPDRFVVGPEVRCDAPVGGIARLVEEDRGLVDVMPSTEEAWGFHTAGISPAGLEDLDHDGDLDFLYGGLVAAPRVQANDGTGHFDPPVDVPPLGPPAEDHGVAHQLAITAADLDGDLLPELVAVGGGFVATWQNLGDLTWGEPRLLHVTSFAEAIVYMAIVLGDFDGDGDADLVLPPVTDADTTPGDEGTPAPILRFRHEADHTFSPMEPLEPVATLVSIGTDRDADGDLDLLVLADQPNPTRFFRNDGDDGMVDDAAETGSDLMLAGMGIDGADLNGDGALDWCFTDVGPPLCLFSAGDQTWYEAARAVGLDPTIPIQENASTVGWSFDLVDLDNDGHLDALQASAPCTSMSRDEPDVRFPDLLWEGQPDGTFVDVTAEAGFGDIASDFGLATGDLDGDGALDMVLTGPGRPSRTWMNRCTEGAWLALELEGSPGNGDALGARVTLDAGGRTQIREVYALRSPVHTPSRLHFGLGATDTVDRLHVRWSDGTETEALDVPARRLVTARHPDAPDAPE